MTPRLLAPLRPCLAGALLLAACSQTALSPVAAPVDGASPDALPDAGAPPDAGPFQVCASPGMSTPRAAFSPDGTRFAITSDVGTLHLHEAGGAEQFVVNGLGRGLSGPGWSPDGQALAVLGPKGLQLRAASDGHALWAAPVESTRGAPRFSPEGRLVAALTDSRVLLWHAADGSSAGSLNPPPLGASRVGGSFSPDGALFLAVSSVEAVLWSVADGQVLHRLKGAPGALFFDAAFSPEGDRVLIAEIDASLVHVFTLPDWQETTLPLAHDRATIVGPMALSAGGAWLALSTVVILQDGFSRQHLEVWQLRDGGAVLDAPRLAWNVNVPSGYWPPPSFSPDGSSLLSADQTVTLRAVSDGTTRLTIDERVDGERGASLSADGQRLLTFGRARVDVWSALDGRHLARHDGGSGDAAFLDGGSTVALALSGQPVIALRDALSGSERGRIDLSAFGSGALQGLAASPDGVSLAAALGPQVVLIPAGAPASPRLLATLPKAAGRLTFSPDGTLLVAEQPQLFVEILEVATGADLGHQRGGIIGRPSVGFSPDGRHLAFVNLPMRLGRTDQPGAAGLGVNAPFSGVPVTVAWASGNDVVVLTDAGVLQILDFTAAVNATGPGTTTVTSKYLSTWSPGWVGGGSLALSGDRERLAAVIPWGGGEIDVRVFCKSPGPTP